VRFAPTYKLLKDLISSRYGISNIDHSGWQQEMIVEMQTLEYNDT